MTLLFVFLVQPRIILSDYQYEKSEKKDWKGHLLCMLEAGGECDMGPHKRVIMDWTREIKSRPQVTIVMVDVEDNVCERLGGWWVIKSLTQFPPCI